MTILNISLSSLETQPEIVMSGETTQQELVWMSPEEYESSVGSQENVQLEDVDHAELPGADLPAILIENGTFYLFMSQY